MRRYVNAENVRTGSVMYHLREVGSTVSESRRVRRGLRGTSHEVVALAYANGFEVSYEPTDPVLVRVPQSEEGQAAQDWIEKLLKLAVDVLELQGKPRQEESMAAVVGRVHELATTYGPEVLEAWSSQ